MKKKAKHSAKRTVRAGPAAPAPVLEFEGEEPAIGEAYFDKVMSALLQVPWSARKWKKSRQKSRWHQKRNSQPAQ